MRTKKNNSGICKCGAQAEKCYNKGNPSYRTLCSACRRGKIYKQYRKKYCEQCGFIPLHICQLDVDHIDGDHNNNSPDNLRTLCANCHRLKSYLNKDHINKKVPTYKGNNDTN